MVTDSSKDERSVACTWRRKYGGDAIHGGILPNLKYSADDIYKRSSTIDLLAT
jgi:hypothetical protein